MQATTLGQDGPCIGITAYGLWRIADQTVPDAERLVGTALDHGLTLIDNADVYGHGTGRGFGGAEALLGELFARDPGLRRRMTLVTKGGVDLPTPYDASEGYLLRACEASLRRMRTDAVDLYLVHRPDPTAHPSETGRALDRIVRSGMAARVGVSNYTPAQADALAAHMDAPLTAMQPEVSAWTQDAMTDGVLDWCARTGATALAWSPLAGGALATGQAKSGWDETAFVRTIAALDIVADAHGATRTQVALAFVRGHGAGPVPIVGTTRPDRIIEAAGAASLTLTRREWFAIVEARRGERLP